MPTTTDTKALLKKAIDALPEHVTLIYIDRNDEFSDKNCAEIVGGNKDNVFEEGWDFSEGEDHAIDEALKEALPDEEEREALEESDDMSEFRNACQERDDSNAYKDVLHNTGKQLIRFYIRDSKGNRIAEEPDSWRWDEKQKEREAKKLCKAAKLDWETNKASLIELVENATYGGVLCVIAYVEMSDVDKWVEHCLHGDERGRVRLTFTDPHLLIHDYVNGSGHDVRVKGDVVISFGRGALHKTHGVMALDATNVGTGYSWDETCGLHKPAYATDVKAHLYRAKKGQKPDKPAPEAWPNM